jgi:hypothetical protein
VNIELLQRYIRYVELNRHIEGIDTRVHDWRDSFDTAKQRICLEVKELSFTWKYNDNVDFLNMQLHPVVKAVYVISQLAPTSVNARESFLVILDSLLSAMEVIRWTDSEEDDDLVVGPPVSWPEKISGHLTMHGIHFWTVVENPPDALVDPRSLSLVGLPLRIKSEFTGKAMVRDFAVWENMVRSFLTTHRARAAISAGGIIWRVVLEYGELRLQCLRWKVPPMLIGVAGQILPRICKARSTGMIPCHQTSNVCCAGRISPLMVRYHVCLMITQLTVANSTAWYSRNALVVPMGHLVGIWIMDGQKRGMVQELRLAVPQWRHSA